MITKNTFNLRKIINARSELTQLKKVYQSTTSFENFLKQNRVLNKTTNSVLDIGCGYGSQIQYFSRKYSYIKFTGWDYSQKKINIANILNKNPRNKFYVQDLLKIKRSKSYDFDLTLSIHTLCCFKNINKVLKSITKVKSEFIAINSLFYDGPLEVLIHIRDLTNPKIKDDNPDGDFNIHSLQSVKQILLNNGYKLVKIKKFFPKYKIKKPKKRKRGSYTIRTEFNKHTVFSGPVYLPWYFILAKKIKVNLDKK
jgi:SAM-dependent methyltransferase